MNRNLVLAVFTCFALLSTATPADAGIIIELKEASRYAYVDQGVDLRIQSFSAQSSSSGISTSDAMSSEEAAIATRLPL